MTDTGFKDFSRAGYTEHAHGYSGPFSWFPHSLFPGKWLVICHEGSFSKEPVSRAVVDDFGDLVRVPA